MTAYNNGRLGTRSKLLLAVCGLGVLLSGQGCSSAPEAFTEARPGQIKVVVSFPPLANFVKNVAGDHAAIISLGTTNGPHDYAYNVKDARYLHKADLFFALGLGLDNGYCDKTQANCGNDKLRYIKLGDKIDESAHDLLLPFGKPEAKKEEGHEKPGHAHAHEHEDDPHIWLGTKTACKMAELIRDELVQLEKKNAQDFERNAAEFCAKLKALPAEFNPKLTAKKNNKLLTFHDSLGYFAASFDVKIVGHVENDPGEDPSPGAMKKLLNLCKDTNPAAITVEPQYKADVVGRIKEELKKENLDIKIIQIDPLETATLDEIKDKDWYLNKMRANLQRLVDELP